MPNATPQTREVPEVGPRTPTFLRLVDDATVAIEPETPPTLTHSVSAILPTVPSPLRLRGGPLLITIDSWSDATVVARLPAAVLQAEGESEILAIDALCEEFLCFAVAMTGAVASGKVLGGPLLARWERFTAMVDTSGIVA